MIMKQKKREKMFCERIKLFPTANFNKREVS